MWSLFFSAQGGDFIGVKKGMTKFDPGLGNFCSCNADAGGEALFVDGVLTMFFVQSEYFTEDN